jgi:hypothetical protein
MWEEEKLMTFGAKKVGVISQNGLSRVSFF